MAIDPALVAEWENASPGERLARLRRTVLGRFVFTTSFGIEDQALTHVIAGAALDIEIVTLDTGLLFPETWQAWRETEKRYGLRIRAVYPERPDLEALIDEQGVDGFYRSVAARQACCDVRKVRPLARALEGASAWITGLRASQSAGRQTIPFVAFDETHGLIKANPLLDWSREAVVDFTTRNAVPVNALHARGFPSIGCAPCTRAVAPGEDERAGRWWWENSGKECGLHIGAGGRPVRAAQTSGGDA